MRKIVEFRRNKDPSAMCSAWRGVPGPPHIGGDPVKKSVSDTHTHTHQDRWSCIPICVGMRREGKTLGASAEGFYNNYLPAIARGVILMYNLIVFYFLIVFFSWCNLIVFFSWCNSVAFAVNEISQTRLHFSNALCVYLGFTTSNLISPKMCSKLQYTGGCIWD